MITLFSTTKNFDGINRSNQLNAIRCWLSASCNPQVIIFGKSVGYESLGNHPNLFFTEPVRLTETGAPYGNEMFDTVNKITKHPICCYVNADILLPSKFFESVQYLHEKLKKNYLLVGERLDVTVREEINFSNDWEKQFFSKYESSMKVHPPAGSDFFVFPKGQYTYSNMPVFYIGRGGWDNRMIYIARKKKYKVVDLTSSVRVIHQNHDYSHKAHPHQSVLEKIEIAENRKGVPHTFVSMDTLGACNYFFFNNRLKKNYTRGDLNTYASIQMSLGEYNFLTRVQVKILRLLVNRKNILF